MQRRRRVKVLIKLFQKFAWCGAELHGLKTGAAGGRVQRTRRIRPTGGSPESGLCGTQPAPSTSKTPGSVAPQEGDIRPPFFVYGKAGRWCPVGTVQRRPRRQPRTTVPHPPEGLGVSPQTPQAFFKRLERKLYLSLSSLSAGRLPAAPRKPRRPKAACVTCPVRSRTAS